MTLESHPVGITVTIVSRVGVPIRGRLTDLTEYDDACRAAIYTQRTSGTDVVVDDKYHVVTRVGAGIFGPLSFDDCVRRDHVDAFPRADVDATFAQDTFGLIDVYELFWFDCAAEVVSVNRH